MAKKVSSLSKWKKIGLLREDMYSLEVRMLEIGAIEKKTQSRYNVDTEENVSKVNEDRKNECKRTFRKVF